MIKTGYTHYWHRSREILQDKFDAMVNDFKKILPTFDAMGIKLGDGRGENQPIFTSNEVVFNGLRKCGHTPNRNIVIPWPAPSTKPGIAGSSQKAIAGSWYAGVLLNQRACDGDCSYETFYFPRIFKSPYETEEKCMFFAFCKTAYRPYDIAVTAFLIIAKHHLGEGIALSSYGEWKDWLDAAQICNNILGYGLEEKLF